MSQKSIHYLESISRLTYIPITEPAHSVKDTFEMYFSGFETDELPKSFKKRSLTRLPPLIYLLKIL